MSSVTLSPTRFIALIAAILGILVATPSVALAKNAAPAGDKSKWCVQGVDGVEALPGDVCYLNGGTSVAARRTLVIFLHGAVAKNTTWQWNHQKMMLRLAKGTHVDILFPRSPKSDVGYVWPGSVASQESVEQELIDNWMNAKRIVEERDGRYDEVFVMGFSSGAYFTSSLAMRGRVDVDGYATFAGGQPMPASAKPVVKFSPVFVGVCSEDDTSAAHSRAFGGSLAAAGIPRMVMEQPVGHGLSDVHFRSALGFLRRSNAKKAAAVAML